MKLRPRHEPWSIPPPALLLALAFLFLIGGAPAGLAQYAQQAYLKPGNTGRGDGFGYSVSVSGDTAVLGARDQGDQSNGAAYVFVRRGTTWIQQAYLRASNTGRDDRFGFSVAVSGDTVVVGAFGEASNATGVDGARSDNSAYRSGAAYVFVRSGTNWTQQAYLKASNTGTEDLFGYSVAVSGDMVVIGAHGEDSNATGVNGNQSDDSEPVSGAAFVFVRTGTNWTQQAYLKASNTGASDAFGYSVAASGDTVVIGAFGEASDSPGVDGNQSSNRAEQSGAAYVFVRSGTNWTQQAYLKASNPGGGDGDHFGNSVAVSGDTVLIGARREDSNATGVNGNQSDDTASASGSAYVFVRSGTHWTQQAYLKAGNTGENDGFGHSVAASGDTVVIGAYGEGSQATGVAANQSDNSASGAGAAYVFLGPPLQPPTVSLLSTSVLLPSGSKITLSASAQGTSTISFQWLRNGLPLTSNAYLSGANTSLLTLSDVQPADAGAYSVRVINPAGSATSGSLVLTVDSTDSDGDGLPDSWEIAFGLNPNSPADANAYQPGDQFTRLQKYQRGLHPLTNDNDGDGRSDFAELFEFGTNPLLSDTDGDEMPDNWELDHGLNPRWNNGGEDLDRDGLTNFQEYQKRAGGYLPNRADSDGDGLSDYERAHGGQRHSQLYYDRNDRLVGAEYANGLALAYVYDGNDNLVRQVHLSRQSEATGLPVLWSFLNGLTNNTPAHAIFGDADGDGWSNWQEWKAGSAPTIHSSVPAAPEQRAKAIARLELPFVPTNWVVLAAQMDGLGAEELLVGADGNANGVTNVLFVLSASNTGWTTKGIPIGPHGVTSLAFGTVSNRNEPAIYAGLRSSGGQGRVLEIRSEPAPAQTLLPIQSTNEAVFLLGMNSGQRLVASLADASSGSSLQDITFQADGSVTKTVLVTNWQGNGSGTVGSVYSRIMRDAYAQVDTRGQIELFAASLEVTGNGALLPANAAQDSNDGRWHFRLDQELTWPDARTELARLGSDLVVIRSGQKNGWLYTTYMGDREAWIGITQQAGPRWLDGDRVDHGLYQNWCDDRPRFGDASRGLMWMSGANCGGRWVWGDGLRHRRPALAVVASPTLYTNRWTVPLTGDFGRSGSAVARPILQAFRPDQTNSASLIYAFYGRSAEPGDGDTFGVRELLIADNTVMTSTSFTTPAPSSDGAVGFALALAQPVQNLGKSLFTAEPDGRIFMWVATNATAPLERRLYDAQHLGHSWRAMGGVKMAAEGTGLIALRAVSTNDTAVEVFLWPPQAVLSSADPAMIQTAPAAIVLPDSNGLGSLAEVRVRLWDAEGNSAVPQLQFQLSGSTDWRDAKLAFNSRQPLSTTPTGTTHPLVWNALADLGPGITANVLLRVRASDITLLGDWSVGTPFLVRTTLNPDSDNDGLPDEWELAKLQGLGYGPNDDPDGDGFTNLTEYRAGTDPNSAESHLALSIHQEDDGQLRLEWTGQPLVPIFLERRTNLSPSSLWEVLQSNPAALFRLPAENGEAYFRLRLGN